jgi:diguanylate cyclase (GGDEF)-like protein
MTSSLASNTPAGLFGVAPRVPKPVLLVLVYAIFLVIVGITATAQTAIVSANYSQTALQSVVGTDAALIRSFVNANVQPGDLDSQGISSERRAELEALIGLLVDRTEILHVELRRPDGTIVVADRPGHAGTVAPMSADFRAAVETETVAASFDVAAESEVAGGVSETTDLLRQYFPLQADGQVHGVVGVWRDAVPILKKLEELRSGVVLTTLSAALVAAFVLWMVFRSAQLRITRQTAALVDATRRDQLTGLLNHGALVGELAIAMERARTDETAIGIALVDLDGFRLLNETYGHDAGDRALLTVRDMLEEELPRTIVRGRYGPDEFLLIAGRDDVAELLPALEALRARLADHELRFDASERLPLSISAGICTYPDHGSAVTELLTTAALTLQEAKASGGDRVRMAGMESSQGETRTFDVFQGLILAVDTKDRYTKRHSEDVARYAVFLARRLGLDEETIQTLRVAGLLHDVGKIGIPDHILRKPGKLTDQEYEIVQQHVVLGDMIVRDLPNVELIRAGVRHHHERWDGKGYIHRLAGEEIPLVARILAVGDTFSAMTTTRPYRKALDVAEALRRLEDAAGTQLDESLVRQFVAGIETDVDAPLPGSDAGPLWAPYVQVA